MTLVLPTAQSAPTYDAQASIDEVDLFALGAQSAGIGVLSGCTVSWVSGMNVAVAAGSVSVPGQSPPVIAVGAVASLPVPAASATDRRDMVVYTVGTGVHVIQGIPCASANWTAVPGAPLPPVKLFPLPANTVLFGEVYVPGGAVALSAANIIDKTPTQISPTTQPYSATFGDGTSTSFVITHGMGTRDVNVYVYQAATPFQKVDVNVFNSSPTTVTISGFSTPPATNSLRAVIVASGSGASKLSPASLLVPGVAENFSRWNVTGVTAGIDVTGHLSGLAMPLLAGQTVTSITFVSGTTAITTPTHYWFALYSPAVATSDFATPFSLIAQTADQGSTPWAVSAPLPLALQTPYKALTDGVYYVVIMCAAATIPNFYGIAAGGGGTALSPGDFGLSPPLTWGDNAHTGLTTTAPAVATPVGGRFTGRPYVVVS